MQLVPARSLQSRKKLEVSAIRLGVVGEDGLQPMRLIVADDKVQSGWILYRTYLGNSQARG
jgi:hypothetical protein